MSTDSAQNTKQSDTKLQSSEAAKLLGVSVTTLFKYEKAGRIQSFREGNGYRFFDVTAALKLKDQIQKEKAEKVKLREAKKARRREEQKAARAEVTPKPVLKKDDKRRNIMEIAALGTSLLILLLVVSNLSGALEVRQVGKLPTQSARFYVTKESKGIALDQRSGTESATHGLSNTVSTYDNVLGTTNSASSYVLNIAIPTFFSNDLNASQNVDVGQNVSVGGYTQATGGISTPIIYFEQGGTINNLAYIDTFSEDSLESILDLAGDVTGALNDTELGDEVVGEDQLDDNIDYDGDFSFDGKIDITGKFKIDGDEVNADASEIDFVDGASVTSGGIVFGNGNNFTQDVSNLFWDDTNNLFGIGTSTPRASLDLPAGTSSYASLRVRSGTGPTSATEGDIFADGTDIFYYDGSSWVDLTATGGGGGTIDGTGIANYLARWSDADTLTTGVIYDTGTNIGVGTTNPSYKLDVAGDINFTGTLYDNGSPFTSGQWTDAGSYIYANNSTSTVITDSDRVGIGTTAPSVALDVAGALTSTGTITFSGLSAGTDNSVLVLNSSNQLATDEIDSKVWAGNLVDVTGSPISNYVTRWSDADTLTTGTLWDNGTSVGIGTTAPSTTFQINDDLYVTSGGNIGIDDNDPQLKLHINANVSGGQFTPGLIIDGSSGDCYSSSQCATGLLFRTRNGTGINRAKAGIAYDQTGPFGIGDLHILNNGDYSEASATLSDAVISILSSGYVGIGNTAPTTYLDLPAGTASAASLRVRTGTNPTSANEGEIYADGTDLFYYDGSSWVDLTVQGGSGDITGVGSMLSGLAFGDATADDDWLGLGASVGRIEFDDQATDEVNILGANVGIGTTAPATKLDIDTGSNTLGLRLRGTNESDEIADFYVGSNGQLVISNVSGNDTAQYLDLRTEDDQYGLILRESDGTAATTYANFYVTDAATDFLNIVVSDAQSTTGLVVTADEYVGIGTTAPKVALDVSGSGRVYGGASPSTPSAGEGLELLFDSDGSVGALSGGSGVSFITSYDRDNTQYEDLWFNAADVLIRSNTDAATGILFDTNGANTRMVITEGGNIGIGTTNPSAKLDVVGTAEFSSTISAASIGADTDNSVVILNSSGLLKTDEIDPKVWDGNLVDVTGTPIANYVTRWSDSDTLTTGTLWDDGTSVGIGTTSPSSLLNILGTTEQLRLSYDASNYLSFTVDSSGNLTIADTGTDIATFGATQASFAVPTVFNAAGDVTAAYDLVFSNQTSSKIESYGPFTIEAGESFENNDLTLKTYGTGDVVADLSGTGNLWLTGTDTSIIFDTTTATDTDYWLGVFDDAGGDDDDLFMIGDGSTPGTNPFLTLNTSGYVGIGNTNPAAYLDLPAGTASAASLRVRSGTGPTSAAAGDIFANGTDIYYYDGSSWVDLTVQGGGGGTIDGSGIANYVASWSDSDTLTTGVLYDNGTNVGIGTTAPATDLHVVATSTDATRGLTVEQLADDSGAGNFKLLKTRGSSKTSSDADNIFNLIWQFYNDAGTPEAISGAYISSSVLDASDGTEDADLKFNQYVAGTNTEVMRFHNGNVGIGTTNPTSKLQVAGNILPTADDSYDLGSDSLRWQDLYLGPGTLHIGTSTSDEYTLGYNTTDNYLGFNVNGSGAEEIVFDSSGYVGIGTTNPSTLLNVLGTTEQLRLNYDGSNYTSFTVDSAGNLTIADTGTDIATFGASQASFSVPTSFNAVGDVSIAYDLLFSNQTSSNIISDGPFSLVAGETFENNDLTLKTYGTGNVIADLTGTGELQLIGTDTSIVFDTTTATDTDYWLGVFDDAGGDDDDLFMIGDGSTPGTNPFLTLNTSGYVGIGTTAPDGDLHVATDSTTGELFEIDYTTATTQTGALTGALLDFTNLTTDGTNSLYGLHVNDQVGATASTEYGIYQQGTNWDYGLYVEDTAFFDAISVFDAEVRGNSYISADYSNIASDSGGVRWYAGDGADPRDDIVYMDIAANDFRLIGNLNGGGASQWAYIDSTSGWQAGSSQELKTNIQELDSTDYSEMRGLLDELVLYSYERKDVPGVTEIGYIAELAPDLIVDDKHTSVNYLKAIGFLSALTKDQHERISALEETGQSSASADPDSLLTKATAMLNELKNLIDTLGLSSTTDEDGNNILAVASDLLVQGDTVLNDLTVTGDLMAGLIQTDSLENSIDVLGPSCINPDTGTHNTELCEAQTLYLQKELAGNVDMFDGAIVLEPNGTINADKIVATTVEAEEVIAEEFSVAGSSTATGAAVLIAGETSVTVPADTVKENSKVFVTATTSTEGQNLYVSEKVNEESFTVTIDSPASLDIEFDWWILNVEDVVENEEEVAPLTEE